MVSRHHIYTFFTVVFALRHRFGVVMAGNFMKCHGAVLFVVSESDLHSGNHFALFFGW